MTLKKNLFLSILFVFFVVIMCGCGFTDNKQATTEVITNETIADQEESSASTISGWWKLNIEDSFLQVINGLYLHIDQDGKGEMFFEYPSGNYYTNVEVVAVDGNDYTIKGDTDVSNIFTLTSDTADNQILLNNDFTEVNGQFITVSFSRTDPSVVDGKEYIYISEAGNY